MANVRDCVGSFWLEKKMGGKEDDEGGLSFVPSCCVWLSADPGRTGGLRARRVGVREYIHLFIIWKFGLDSTGKTITPRGRGDVTKGVMAESAVAFARLFEQKGSKGTKVPLTTVRRSGRVTGAT